MVEAEGGPFGETSPVVPGRFKEGVGSNDVGPDERCGPVDRAVDVRLGGKVHDGIGLILPEHPLHPEGVTDINLLEVVPGTSVYLRERFQVACVG